VCIATPHFFFIQMHVLVFIQQVLLLYGNGSQPGGGGEVVSNSPAPRVHLRPSGKTDIHVITTAGGTVLTGGRIRKVENSCSKASPQPTLFFDRGSLIGTCGSPTWVRLATNNQGSPCLYFPNTVITDICTMASFLCGYWGSNLSPQTCMAST
jgi:hypothetical protein